MASKRVESQDRGVVDVGLLLKSPHQEHREMTQLLIDPQVDFV